MADPLAVVAVALEAMGAPALRCRPSQVMGVLVAYLSSPELQPPTLLAGAGVLKIPTTPMRSPVLVDQSAALLLVARVATSAMQPMALPIRGVAVVVPARMGWAAMVGLALLSCAT